METSVKRQESAISQDILFSQLARNLRIRNEPDIMTRQAIALIRNKRIDVHTYFEHFNGPALLDDWKRGSSSNGAFLHAK